MADQSWNQQYALYLPRTLVEWQLAEEAAPIFEDEGTFLLVDISGFTALSELLADKGKVGAEEVTEILNGAFTELLDIVMEDGGDLLRFGGDALFNLYRGPGHAARACRSALDMRDALDDFQRQSSPTPLEMSVGVATGPIHGFLAGTDSRELLFVGPTASEVVRLQDAAHAGQILASEATVEQVGDSFFGDEVHGGRILDNDPDPDDDVPIDDLTAVSHIDLASFVPSQLRSHVSLAFNEGEHRPATIGFVRFTGTDALFAAGTIEEVAGALDTLVRIAQEAALRNGVTFLASDVNRDGGKLILTTGVPNRQEGQGERMLRCLRDIVDAAPPLPVHIGVARGHIFAGDLGARFRRVYTVMGDSVNLAARLAAQAEAGEILVTSRALDRSDAAWETVQREPIELKGKTKPVAPLSVGALIEVDAARHDTVFALTGRDSELEELLRLAREAASDHGRVIELVGPAGIGKTRLIEEVAARLGAMFECLYLDSEQYEASTPYFVAGRLLKKLLDIKRRSPDEVGEDLAAAVGSQFPQLLPWVPLLADVLGATSSNTAEVDTLAEKFRDAKVRETVVELLRLRLRGPTLLVVDDIHWIDDSSGSILEAIAAAAPTEPWVLVLTGRPSADTPIEIDNATTIALGPLSDEGALDLIVRAAPSHLPLPIAQAIAQRSGGNPFFLVELAKGGATLDQSELPETIEAVTLASIDRLEPRDRRLLRTASVFGERFALDLVADAVSDLGPLAEDIGAWNRLDSFLTIDATGRVHFRQAIVRDVAYQGLSFRRRRELHAAVGNALERRARRRPERYAELLSLHFHRAEIRDKAWQYSVMAADRAAQKHAGAEAVTLYRRALAAARHLEELDVAELVRVNEALGDACDLVGLYGDADQAYDDALALAQDDPSAPGRLLRKKGFVQISQGDLDGAEKLLEQSLERLPNDDHPSIRAERLETEIAIAGHHFRRGQYEACVEWCSNALDLANGDPRYERETAHAHSLRSAAYTHLSGMDGTDDARLALEVFDRLGDLVAVADAFNNLGYDAYYRGDWEVAITQWSHSAEAREKAGDVVGTATALHNLGEIALDQGRYGDAEEQLSQALRIWQGAAFKVGISLAQANLARLATRSGRLDEAGNLLDQADRGFREMGAGGLLMETALRRAEWLLFTGSPSAAEALSVESLDEARGAAGSEVLAAGFERVLAYARFAQNDRAGAREAAHRSLAHARGAEAVFEIAQALEAACRFDTEAPVEECDMLFARLGVRARPVVPGPPD